MTTPRTSGDDPTCYIERSKVREILVGSNIDNESTSEVLQEVDALPIFTASDFAAALPAESKGGMVKPTLMDPISSERRISSEGCPNDIVGHKTFATGEICPETGFPLMRHEPLTRAEGNALRKRAEDDERLRAERMPDEQAAIRALWDAHQRLKDFGWREPQYCPKDGSSFKVIELGSTGIFDCNYQGDWKDGLYMVSDGQDIYPTSDGVAMFKLLPADEEKRKQRMVDARAKYQAESASAQNLSAEPVASDDASKLVYPNWTPDQFWEYVEGLTDPLVRDQMRDMMRSQGLSVSSTEGRTP